MRCRALGALAAALLLAGPLRIALAVPGTCTVLRFIEINPNLGLDFAVPVANGLAMPVEVDAASGSFAMSRDVWASTFGGHYCNQTQTQACVLDVDCPVGEACATGASFETIGGVHGFLVMDPGTVTGTIDAAGNVTLPDFAETLLTDYSKPLPSLSNAPTVTTGVRQQTLGGTAYPTVGVALDFTSGELTVAGTDVLVGAPGGNSDNQSGFKMTCQLDPIPTSASLPKPGLSITKVQGTVRSPRSEAGSGLATLSLKATIVPAASTPAIDGTQDFFVRLGSGGAELALLFVPVGAFTAKGKTLTATRDDTCSARSGHCKSDKGIPCTAATDCTSGTKAIQVFAPDAADADLEKLSGTPMLGGRVVVKRGRKGVRLAATVPGLALTGLGSSGTISVTAGTMDASRPIVVRGTGGKRTFK